MSRARCNKWWKPDVEHSPAIDRRDTPGWQGRHCSSWATSMWPSWWMVSRPGAHSGCLWWGSLYRPIHETVRGRNVEGRLSTGCRSTRRLGTRPSVDYLPLDYPDHGCGTGRIIHLVYCRIISTFQTSRNALVSQNARYIQRFEEIDKDFYDLDAFIVVVEPQRLERGKQFVDTLADAAAGRYAAFYAVLSTRSIPPVSKAKNCSCCRQRICARCGNASRMRRTLLTDLAAAPGLQTVVSIGKSRDQQGTRVASGHGISRDFYDLDGRVGAGPGRDVSVSAL